MYCTLFFFNDTATTEIYTSFPTRRSSDLMYVEQTLAHRLPETLDPRCLVLVDDVALELVYVLVNHSEDLPASRSEEHTSELQSRQYLVCRLLLEKKTTN